MSVGEGRLRLTILGGFLGSGKTTWLRHQLHDRNFGRVHVIVNEVADAPVDDALLQGADHITLLAGACVCCTGQARLVDALLRICDNRSKSNDPETRLDHIVLETSGLADPAAIVALIQAHPVLVRQIVFAEVNVIVDAENAAEQIQGEALCRKQIEAADRLILTKTENASDKQISLLCKTLETLSPGADKSAAIFGTPTALPQSDPDVAALNLINIDEQDAAPIRASQLDLGDAPDWTAFTVWLSALLHARGDQIIRVKGVVRTPAGRLLLQTVRQSVQSPEILPDTESCQTTDNTIAVIGRRFTCDQLAKSLAQFTA